MLCPWRAEVDEARFQARRGGGASESAAQHGDASSGARVCQRRVSCCESRRCSRLSSRHEPAARTNCCVLLFSQRRSMPASFVAGPLARGIACARRGARREGEQAPQDAGEQACSGRMWCSTCVREIGQKVYRPRERMRRAEKALSMGVERWGLEECSGPCCAGTSPSTVHLFAPPVKVAAGR